MAQSNSLWAEFVRVTPAPFPDLDEYPVNDGLGGAGAYRDIDVGAAT
jgi:hypothetical protein